MEERRINHEPHEQKSQDFHHGGHRVKNTEGHGGMREATKLRVFILCELKKNKCDRLSNLSLLRETP